jgi:hypothetical protein
MRSGNEHNFFDWLPVFLFVHNPAHSDWMQLAGNKYRFRDTRCGFSVEHVIALGDEDLLDADPFIPCFAAGLARLLADELDVVWREHDAITFTQKHLSRATAVI